MFEIGNSLREARTRRGVDIAQTEHATKIRAKYLRALEDEQFELLPSTTYVKGFLRTYADYLGLDGQMYVDEYSLRYDTSELLESPRSSRRAQNERRERRVQANVVLIAIAAITAITTVVISAWTTSGGGRTSPRVSHVARVTRAAVPTALVVSAVSGPSHMMIHRNGPSGAIVFEGTLARGESESFTGSRFWLNLGAPENLRITIGGRRVPVAGYRPWVLAVTLSPAHWQGHPA